MKEESSDWIVGEDRYTWFEYDLIKALNERKKEINMKKQEIEFRDPVVQSVVNKFVDRSDVGFKKYGKTLRDDKSDLFTWLNHVQEELMDATLYIQRLKEEISNLREERLLRDAIHDLDVVDPEVVVAKKKKKRKSSKIMSGRGDHYTFTIDESGSLLNKKYGTLLTPTCGIINESEPNDFLKPFDPLTPWDFFVAHGEK